MRNLNHHVLQIRFTKHTYTTKDRVTRSQLIIGGALRCSRWVHSSCSTSGTRRVNLVTTPVISHLSRKGPESIYDKVNIFVVICDTDIPQR